jgi:membrane protein implicated in regulation of membrane protease activity
MSSPMVAAFLVGVVWASPPLAVLDLKPSAFLTLLAAVEVRERCKEEEEEEEEGEGELEEAEEGDCGV